MTGILRALFGPGTWGTGGNLVAWALLGVVTAVVTYLLRNWLGPKLAAFMHRHQGQHMRAELEAVEKRLMAKLDAQHQATHRRLDDHADLIRAAAAQSLKGTPDGKD